MSELWIRNPGAESEYGPVTLVQLRQMMNAGLIFENTRVRDGVSDSREIPAWPALADERVKSWRPGTPSLNRAGWQGERAGEVGVEAGRESSLRLGRAIFTPTDDAASTPGALEVLAINRAHEPDKPLNLPPWWRHPFLRNLARYFGVIVPLTGGTAWYWVTHGLSFKNDMPMLEVQLTAYNSILIFGWGWYVWFIAPANWSGKD